MNHVCGGPMSRLAMEASRRRLARDQEMCEAAPVWGCGEHGRLRWIEAEPGDCHPGGLRHVATVAGDDVESSWCLVGARPATADELRELATALGVSRG